MQQADGKITLSRVERTTSSVGLHGGVCATIAVRLTLGCTVALHELLLDLARQNTGAGLNHPVCNNLDPPTRGGAMQCNGTVARLSTGSDNAYSAREQGRNN